MNRVFTSIAALIIGLLAATAPTFAQSYGSSSGDLAGLFFGLGALGIIFSVIALIIYLVPTFVAFHRQHPNKWIIFLVNLFLGGTIIGWIAALIWAMLAFHITKEGRIINDVKATPASS